MIFLTPAHTLREVISRIKKLESDPRFHSAVLLHKEGRCEVEMAPDFVGFNISRTNLSSVTGSITKTNIEICPTWQHWKKRI